MRREIARRLLHGRIDGKVAVEMLAVLLKDLDSGGWATTDADLAEWLDEEEAEPVDLWEA